MASPGGQASASCRPSPVRAPASLPVTLEMAPALGLCRVQLFRFMMENGLRDWGNLLVTNEFQLAHESASFWSPHPGLFTPLVRSQACPEY